MLYWSYRRRRPPTADIANRMDPLTFICLTRPKGCEKQTDIYQSSYSSSSRITMLQGQGRRLLSIRTHTIQIVSRGTPKSTISDGKELCLSIVSTQYLETHNLRLEVKNLLQRTEEGGLTIQGTSPCPPPSLMADRRADIEQTELVHLTFLSIISCLSFRHSLCHQVKIQCYHLLKIILLYK